MKKAMILALVMGAFGIALGLHLADLQAQEGPAGPEGEKGKKACICGTDKKGPCEFCMCNPGQCSGRCGDCIGRCSRAKTNAWAELTARMEGEIFCAGCVDGSDQAHEIVFSPRGRDEVVHFLKTAALEKLEKQFGRCFEGGKPLTLRGIETTYKGRDFHFLTSFTTPALERAGKGGGGCPG